jgi:hypothetical protein
MLLRLAGHVPDEMLTWCRRRLAEGRLVDLATTVTHTAVASGVAMTSDDVALLADLHRDAGIAAPRHTRIPIGEIARMPAFEFAAQRPAPRCAQRSADGAAPASMRAGGTDAVTEAIVRAAGSTPAVRVVWEAWRFPDNEAPWPPPGRVFVAEVEPVADLPAVTEHLQQVLGDAGETAPRVEVYPVGAEPPPYQQFARNGAAVRYLRDDRPEVRLAPVYDGADDTGPWFDPDHPRLDGAERVLVLNYLSSGEPLMRTSARIEDVLLPEAGQLVPISFRTDGYWVWSDATWYYLDRHSLAPDQPFLDHIRGRDHLFTEVDEVGIQRAMALLREPADTEPVWAAR